MSIWSYLGEAVGTLLGRRSIKRERERVEAQRAAEAQAKLEVAKDEVLLQEFLRRKNLIILLLAATALSACAALGPIGEFLGGARSGYTSCVAHPEQCLPVTPTPALEPEPEPTETPAPEPTVVAEPCTVTGCVRCCPVPGEPGVERCAAFPCLDPTPTPTPTAPAAPSPTLAALTPTPRPSATPGPSAACVPAPGPEPVSLRQSPRCRAGYEPVDFLGDPTLCAVRAGEGNGRTAWRLGYGLDRQGMQLTQLRGATVQEDIGRGCTDADGRFYPQCNRLYEHPEGPTAPYTWGGYSVPQYCGSATPTPTPGPEPTAVPGDCSAVAAIEHGVAGGGHCHAWHPLAGGRVYCVLDSTIRPICDTDHLENWNSFCGRRTHDPAYDSAAGAQLWTVYGAEDWGPQEGNSAQRVIVGPAGGEVVVTVCLRQDVRTADGCPLPLRGDPCASSSWHLPSGGDQ